jgi:trehalose-phosphatase
MQDKCNTIPSGFGGVTITSRELPWATASRADIEGRMNQRPPGFFVDFDGTLAPIAARPEIVVLPERTRRILRRLGDQGLVCLISGRDLDDLRRRVGLPHVYYAGDHGYRIAGPQGSGIWHEVAGEAHATIHEAALSARPLLASVEGAVVDEKHLSLSIHYRLTPPAARPCVSEVVHEIGRRFPSLRQTGGKLVHEFHPRQEWDKGAAMLWLLSKLGHTSDTVCPICLGDDLTDENIFAAAKNWGISIHVGPPPTPTKAEYMLRNPEEVADFLEVFTQAAG